MNVLLIVPPISRHYDTLKFPLGLGYIAAVLLRAGHEVQVLDTNALRLSESEIECFLKDARFDLVGLSGFIPHYEEVKWLTQTVGKYSSAPIVVGGGLASAAPEIVLQDMPVDVAVVGEGESVMLELVSAFDQGADISDIKGIWYRDGDELLSTGPRERVENLSSLPFPAWDLFPIEVYLDAPTPLFRRRRKLSMITGRGCPYRCSFCFHGIFGHTFRRRPVDDVMDEIETLHSRFQVTAIAFEDDTFMLDKDWVHRLCDVLINSGLKVFWACNGRANLVDADMLSYMRRAGCVSIAYGVETGSAELLKRIRKGITVEQNQRAIQLTWRHGMIPYPFMMIGLPGETLSTIADSVRFCERTKVLTWFTIATPIPDTDLYRQAVQDRRIVSKRDVVKKWGQWTEAPIVNLTTMSDSQLLTAKTWAERQIALNFALKRWSSAFRTLCIEARVNGLGILGERITRGMRWVARNAFARG